MEWQRAVGRAAPLILLALLGPACAREVTLVYRGPATLHREPGGFERAVVTRVIDGDTVEVRIVGREAGPGSGQARVGGDYDVRLIGIDTPETVDPRRSVQCFGKEASTATTALVEGKQVTLVKDVEETDGFGRLLRYVYFGEEMVGARLVANGYALAYTYPPNVRWSQLLVELEREARGHDRGLWSPDACNGRP